MAVQSRRAVGLARGIYGDPRSVKPCIKPCADWRALLGRTHWSVVWENSRERVMHNNIRGASEFLSGQSGWRRDGEKIF